MAQSNIDIAKRINKSLKSDLGIMEALEHELGSARAAKKFQKKIEGCSKKISIQRLIIKLKKKRYDCAKDACTAAIDDLKSVVTGKIWKNITMAKQLKDNENTGKVVKAATTVGKEVVKAGVKGATMAGKEIAKDKVDETKKKVTDKVTNKVDKFMGTKRGEGVNKKARDFIMGGTEEERYAKKVAKKEAKRIEKNLNKKLKV